jgi:hypothetical protein
VKNLLLLAGAAALGLVLLWVLLADGGRRSSTPAPAPGPEHATASAAGPELTRVPEPAPVAERAAPSARTETEAPISTSLRRLTGTVLVQGGGPPGPSARVGLYTRGERADERQPSEGGRFALSLAIPARSVVLRIEAEGFASLERDLGDQLEPGELELGTLWLQAGAPLEGVVIGPAGAPVERAEVRLAGRRAMPSEFMVGDRAATGADGRFRFPNAPAGVVVVTARAAGLGESSVEILTGHRQEVRLVLEAERTLRVRVVEPGGAPISGVDVELRSSDPLFPSRKRATDADGRASFEALGAPIWNVLALARGYKPAGYEDALADGSEIQIELRSWPSITGRLLAPGGGAAPHGALVLAFPRLAMMRGDVLASSGTGEAVGAEGRFRLVDLRPGEYVVRAEAPGFAATLSSPVTVGEEGEVSLGDLVLIRGGTLALRLHTDGGPAAGVMAETFTTAPAPNQALAPRGPEPPGRPGRPASDAEGELTLAGLPPGSAWVLLRGEDIVPVVAGPFSISNELTTGPIRIDLRPGRRLAGRVLAANGQPVPRARLRVIGAGLSIPFLEADESGHFASVPLPPGVYTLEAFPVPGGPQTTSSTEVRLDANEEHEIVFRLDA